MYKIKKKFLRSILSAAKRHKKKEDLKNVGQVLVPQACNP
jgi:hypothetical protein